MINKILVPLDGSKLAEKALPYAEAFAQKFDAALILVWVLQDVLVVPSIDYAGTIPPIDLITARQDEEAKAYLSQLQNNFRQQNIPVRIEVLKGHDVADTLIDLARREKVDVIIKTTHGRSGLSRWIYGNVAAKVLQRAPCPVFLVRVSEKDPVE